LSLQGVTSSSLLNHGGAGLDRIGGHTTTPAKPCELGVYDGGGAHDLPRARESFISHTSGGYVMACAVFYERGLGVPSYRFLHSLLQFYGL
jgi:hypothetical protein